MIRMPVSSLIDRSRSWLKWSRDLARERGCHVFRYQRCPFPRDEMVPRVSRRSPLSMKSYAQYIARDVRWYIIVKPHVSYDGGVPVGGHAKVASQTEDVCCSCVLYIPHTYIY
jgi:hypothetical protein